MHDHNRNNNGGHNGMMWMMMICCLAPVLLIFLFGSGAKALGTPVWIVIGSIVVFAIAHFVFMRKTHHHSDNTEKQSDSHSDHCK